MMVLTRYLNAITRIKSSRSRSSGEKAYSFLNAVAATDEERSVYYRGENGEEAAGE